MGNTNAGNWVGNVVQFTILCWWDGQGKFHRERAI